MKFIWTFLFFLYQGFCFSSTLDNSYPRHLTSQSDASNFLFEFNKQNTVKAENEFLLTDSKLQPLADSLKNKQMPISLLTNGLIRFEENVGQFSEQVKYRVSDAQSTHFFMDGEIRTLVRGSESEEKYIYGLEFLTKTEDAEYQAIGGGRSQKGKKSYHTERGSFPDVPLHRRLHYENIWDGVSAIFYEQEGQLKYDFEVSPGVAPETVQLRMKGAEDIRVNEKGELEFSTSIGRLTKGAPYTYQNIDGKQVPVETEYIVKGDTLSFSVGEYDASLPLIIDPIALKYAAFLGEGFWQPGDGYYDPVTENLYITGTIDPDDVDISGYPAFGPVETTTGGSGSVILMCMEKDGSAVLWSTIIGGTDYDVGLGVYVDVAGDIFLKGITRSPDFPVNGTVAAFDDSHAGNYDQFVMRLNADASQIRYSSYFGGYGNNSGNYTAHGIVVIGDNIYGSGTVRIGEFPELPAPTYLSPVVPPDQNDAMAGVYSINTTVPGAAGLEGFALIGYDLYGADDIQSDAAGNIYILGHSYEINDSTLTADAVQTVADIGSVAPEFINGGGGLPLLAKFDSSLSNLLYASYVMPTFGNERIYGQARQMLAVNDGGDMFVMTDQYFNDEPTDGLIYGPTTGPTRDLSNTDFSNYSILRSLAKIPASNPSTYSFINTLAGDDFYEYQQDIGLDSKGRIHVLNSQYGGSSSANYAQYPTKVNTTSGAVLSNGELFDQGSYDYAPTYSVYSPTGALLYGTILPSNGECSSGYSAMEIDEETCTAYIMTATDSNNDSQPIVTPSYRDPETGAQVNVLNAETRPSDKYAYIAVFHDPVPTGNTITDFQAGNNTFCVGSLIHQDPNDGPIQGEIPAFTSGDGSNADHNLPDLMVSYTGIFRDHPTPKSPKGTYMWQVSRDSGTSWEDIPSSNLPVLKPDPETMPGVVEYRRTYISGCCDTIYSNTATATIAGSFSLLINAPSEPVYYCPGTPTDLGITVSGASGNISWQWYNGFAPVSNSEISPASGTNIDQASFTASIPASQTGAGFYRLVVTDAGGCKREASATIAPISAQAGVGPSMPICPGTAGNVVELGPGAVNPAFDYLWNGPSGFTSTEPNPSVGTAGTYTLQVALTGTGNYCAAGANSVDVTAFSPHDPALTSIPDAEFCQPDDPAPIGLSGAAPGGYVFQWSPGINIDNQVAYSPVFDPGTLPFDVTPIAEVEYTFTALRDDGCIFETTMMVSDTALALANAGSDRATCGAGSSNIGRSETTGLHWQWEAVSTTYPSGLAALVADPDFAIDGVNVNLGTNKFAEVSAPVATTDCYDVVYELKASYVPFPTNCLTRDTVVVTFCPPSNCNPCPRVSGSFTGSDGFCGGATAVINASAVEGLDLFFTTYSVDGVVQPDNTPPMGLFQNSGGTQGAAVSAAGPHPNSVIVNFDDPSWGWAGANVVTYQLSSSGFVSGTQVDCSLLFQVFSGQNAQPVIGLIDKSLCAFPEGAELGNSGLGIPYTLSGVDYSQAPNSGFNWTWREVGGNSSTVTAGGNTPFPTIEPTNSTAYEVIARDPVTGCPAFDTIDINVVNVIADAGTDVTAVCQGSLIQLGSAEQPNHTYNWTPATGLNFPIGVPNNTAPQPFLTVPDAPSGITYTLSVTEGTTGCQASDAITITTNSDPPVQPATTSWTVCTTEDAVINVGLAGSALAGHAYTWSVFSGGGSIGWLDDPNLYEPVFTVPQGTAAGAYVFRLTVTKGSCGSVTQDYTINVEDPATVDLGVDVIPNCTTPFTELSTASTAGYIYRWVPSAGLYTDDAGTMPYNGGTSSANHTMYAEPSGSDRGYTLIATRGSTCSSSDMITVLSATPEEVSAGSDDSYCPGGPAYSIGVSNSGTTHLWEAVGYNADPEGTPATPTAGEASTMIGYLGSSSSNVTAFSQSSTAPGVYVYRLTSTFANGCSLSDEVQIRVPVLDSGFAGPTQAVCEGESFLLGAEPINPDYSYFWTALNPNTEDYTIEDQNAARALVTPIVTTTYQVTATSATTGCEVVETVLVTVTPRPDIADVDLPVVCAPTGAIDLTAQVPAYGTYFNPVWYENIIPGTVVNTPTAVMPTQSTDYFVTLENDFACQDTARITVNVESPQTPIITASVPENCNTLTVDLAEFQGIPSDPSYTLEWHNANNTDPSSLLSSTVVGTGTYYLFERTGNDCFSSSAVLTVVDGSCPLYSLGNQVFADTDNSGDLNGSETGIDGVQLQLLNGDGTVYDSDPNTPGIQALMVTTANNGYYRFDDLPVGSYIVEVLASNFDPGGILANLINSTGSNQEAMADDDGDNNDNGLDVLTAGAVRSAVITLTREEPTGETEPGVYAFNSITGATVNDNRNNLTVDFGFFNPCMLTLTENSQNNCIDPGTAGDASDDYYTITLNATAVSGGISNQYEVLLNGIVLATETYGTAVTLGDGTNGAIGTFAADGATTYSLVVRDVDNPACEVGLSTIPRESCSVCPRVCLPVQIMIRPGR